jgi:hypothetical protein
MTEVIAIITSTSQLPICRAWKYSMTGYCWTHWVFARTNSSWAASFIFNPNNPLKNSTCFPLCKRGIKGDFCISATSQSPLTPLLQRGEYLGIAQFTTNGQSGFNTSTATSAMCFAHRAQRPYLTPSHPDCTTSAFVSIHRQTSQP